MKTNNSEIEKYRVRTGKIASSEIDGNNGYFILPGVKNGKLLAIVSDGGGWEHVSVSPMDARGRACPTWREMCYVKDIFWGADEWVIQYHPAASRYVNIYPNVLHLWKPVNVLIPTPPIEFV